MKEALRTKNDQKNINLKFIADSYRCKLVDDMAYEVAALFTHWAPIWQSMMSAENWAKLVMKFKRGGLDAQLLEKCSSKIAHGATDFRFLQAFGSALVQIPVSPESLDAKQHEAQLAREKAEMEEAKVLVSREENKRLKHKADAQAWNSNMRRSVQRSRRRRGSKIRQSLSKR